MSFLTKLADKQSMAREEALAIQGSLKDLPAVYEYLVSEKFPDGSARERSTMLVLVEGGVVKVCLSDRDQGRQMWRAGRSLEDCLLSLEEALQSSVQDWRVPASYGKKKK